MYLLLQESSRVVGYLLFQIKHQLTYIQIKGDMSVYGINMGHWVWKEAYKLWIERRERRGTRREPGKVVGWGGGGGGEKNWKGVFERVN